MARVTGVLQTPPEGGRVGPSVRWRPGGQQLAGDLELLRFEIADINVMIKKACADSLSLRRRGRDVSGS